MTPPLHGVDRGFESPTHYQVCFYRRFTGDDPGDAAGLKRFCVNVPLTSMR